MGKRNRQNKQENSQFCHYVAHSSNNVTNVQCLAFYNATTRTENDTINLLEIFPGYSMLLNQLK